MPIYSVITCVIELLAIVAGAYTWRKLSMPYRLLLLHVILAFITELLAWVISHYLHIYNVFVYNVYVILEAWLLGTACNYFIKSMLARRLIVVLLMVITLFWLLGIYANGFDVFNNWLVVFTALFYAVFYIYALFDNSIFSKKKVYIQPLFLIAISIVIYYTTIIPLFGVLNYVVDNDSQIATKLFYINNIANPVRYALVALAFYLYARQAKRGYVQQ